MLDNIVPILPLSMMWYYSFKGECPFFSSETDTAEFWCEVS